MNHWKKAKQDYEHIQIPKDLDSIVDHAIAKGRSKKLVAMNKGWAVSLTAFASFLLLMNVSSVFAQTVTKLPWIGSYLRVFTFTHIETSDDLTTMNVNIPALQDTGNPVMERSLNFEINEKITQLAEECKFKAQAYWDSFLKLNENQTEDTMDKRTFEFYTDYDIKMDQGNIISFVIHVEEASASVEHLNFYYNLNVQTGEALTLEELVGSDYIEKINPLIQAQIDERNKESSEPFYFDEESAFESIIADQNFYINAQGQLVIVFERYTIAPGYVGEPEFIMPFQIQLPE